MAMNKQELINGVRSRKPTNNAEGICYDEMTADGWTLTKRGWPDYFAFRDGEIVAVEVKKGITQNLKREQHKVIQALTAHGMKCYVFTPGTGMMPYSEWLQLYERINGKPAKWSCPPKVLRS